MDRLFMVSIASPDQYYQLFLAQGLGMGIGGGFIYIPCAAVQSHRWRQRRGLALGIIYSGARHTCALCVRGYS